MRRSSCAICDRESLVRLGEQFLCASCAMNVLRDSVEDFEGLTEAGEDVGDEID